MTDLLLAPAAGTGTLARAIALGRGKQSTPSPRQTQHGERLMTYLSLSRSLARACVR